MSNSSPQHLPFVGTVRGSALNGSVTSSQDQEQRQALNPSTSPTIGPVPRRWVVLAFFALLSTANGMVWLTYSSIFNATQSRYDVSSNEVNYMSMCFMLVFVIAVFPALHMFRSLGCRKGLLMAALFGFVGAVLKIPVEMFVGRGRTSFWWIISCQLIASLANAIFLGGPPLVASLWFPESERGTATAIASLANNFGGALGFLIPPQLVKERADGSVEGFMALYVFEAAIALVPLIGFLVFVPEKPHQPPSLTASVMGSGDSKLADDVRLLFTHHGFTQLFIVCSGAVGLLWAVSTVLGQLTAPWGMSAETTGWCGCANLIAGILSSVVVGRWIDRRRRYRTPASLLCFLAAGTLALLIACLFVLPTDASVVVCTFLLYVAAGAFQTSAVPVLLEMGVEVTYPIDEIVSSGVLMLGANAFAAVSIFSVGVFVDGTEKSPARFCWVGVAVCLVACGLVMKATRPAYLRVESEQSPIASPNIKTTSVPPSLIMST
eukprot:PhM_4_TR4660/c0_g1_i1/m.35273/K08220/FLVCR, SLC49A1_2; MFS transporter, FLVCR family, feline leukemia virus subgroup C receptor-related protein